MKRYLGAVPPYLGGKRQIARQIMRVIADDYGVAPGATLADAFMGGAAVSMAGKALGYRVIGNDMGPISVATGKALIENKRITLSAAQITTALEHEPIEDMPDEKELSIPTECRQVLATIVAAEREAQEMTRWLLRAWIARLALSMSSWGIPTMAAGRREWDELTPGQATQLLRTGKPLAMAVKAADTLNAGVFDNGLDNRMYQGDAVEFLANVDADIAYLDPPYPGTLAYEQVYAGVNHLLDPEYPAEPSDWSAEDGWKLLQDAFTAADNIPLVVISMGRGADPEAISDMMRDAGREPAWKSLDHKHLSALKTEHDPDGDELLLMGAK